MTTGLIVSGAFDQPHYRKKQWSGTDGVALRVRSQPRYFFVKKLDRMVTITRHKRGRAIIKRVPKFRYELVVRNSTHVVRNHTEWHTYSSTIIESTNRKSPYTGNYLGRDPTAGAPSVWTSNDTLALYAKLNDAVRGHSFNMGVAIGEGRESIALLVDTCHRFATSVRYLKRGNVGAAVRALGISPKRKHDIVIRQRSSARAQGFTFEKGGTLSSKDVSSLWLEIQYGWRPLITDVYESMKAYSVLTDPARKDRTVVQYRNKPAVAVTYPTGSPSYSIMTERHSISQRIIFERTEVLSAQRSLGLADPRSVVWELVPFSFVADWFIPIGTYFDALAIIPKLSGRFLITSRDYRTGVEIGYGGPYPGASTKAERITVSRTLSTSLTVPRPEFKPLSEALSLGHIKNALALVHQVFL